MLSSLEWDVLLTSPGGYHWRFLARRRRWRRLGAIHCTCCAPALLCCLPWFLDQSRTCVYTAALSGVRAFVKSAEPSIRSRCNSFCLQILSADQKKSTLLMSANIVSVATRADTKAATTQPRVIVAKIHFCSTS